MINYETILSLFDDKLTLLEYLTKIEQALRNEQLTDITVTQTDASHVYFTFVFEDSTTIDTPTFTLPAGPQGIQGPAGSDGTDGVSVTGATIDASNHLILTLSNGNTIDAGKVAVSNNVVELSGLSGTLTDEQYSLLQANGSKILRSERYFEKVYEDSTSIDFEIINFVYNDTYRYRIIITKSTKAWTFVSHSAIIPATNIYAQGVTDGKVLTVDNGASKWADPTGLTSVKASNIDSETATSGKVLTANGSAGATWEDPAGLTSVKVSDIDSESTGAHFSILANGSGGAYWGAPPVTAGQITSVGATAGQVLTADGANGVSWQTASGGTTLNKYTYSFGTGTVSTRVLNIINNSVSFKIYKTTLQGRLYFKVGYAQSNYWSFEAVTSENGGNNADIYVYFNSVLSTKGTHIYMNAGSISSQTALTTAENLTIEYWNETEITS